MGHRVNQVTVHHALPFEHTVIDADVQLIATPGHTAGRLSTLVEVGGARVLFTADFVWRANGRWRPGNSSP